jgi:predicted enzyme related to lactoylglutathione lyase
LEGKLEKAKLELSFYEDIFGVKFEEVTPGGEVYRLMIEGYEEKCLIERIKLK